MYGKHGNEGNIAVSLLAFFQACFFFAVHRVFFLFFWSGRGGGVGEGVGMMDNMCGILG